MRPFGRVRRHDGRQASEAVLAHSDSMHGRIHAMHAATLFYSHIYSVSPVQDAPCQRRHICNTRADEVESVQAAYCLILSHTHECARSHIGASFDSFQQSRQGSCGADLVSRHRDRLDHCHPASVPVVYIYFC